MSNPIDPTTVEKATLALTNDRRERHGLSRIYRLPWTEAIETEKRNMRVALEAVADDLRAEGAAEARRDEYHTMDELYEYRMLYNALAANAMPDRAVKSWRHSDGEECFGGGWFVVFLNLPSGQVSNHYKAEHWDLFRVPEADLAPVWDGHTPDVAAQRLYEAVRTYQIEEGRPVRRPEFTERQADAWPEAIAEAQRYVKTSTISTSPHSWVAKWDEEVRPGRGHHFDGIWCDGEYLAQVRMDVYGYPSVSVAAVDWLHNSSDEQCPCAPCVAEREDDR